MRYQRYAGLLAAVKEYQDAPDAHRRMAAERVLMEADRAPIPTHGDLYYYTVKKCRCGMCKAANTEYWRQRRAGR